MELTERTHSHLGIGQRKKTERTKGKEGNEKTEFGQDAAISEEEAIFVQSYKSCARTLILSTPWMRSHLESIVCKFGRNRAIFLVD